MVALRHSGFASADGGGGRAAPRIAYFAAAALVAWLVVPFAVILGAGIEGVTVLTVCVAFIAFVAGMCFLALKPTPPGASAQRPPDPRTGSGASATRGLPTGSGMLPPRAAAVQILIVPGAVALGFTALALLFVVLGY